MAYKLPHVVDERSDVVTGTGAALFGVPLAFGLAYFFTDQIEAIMADVHRAEPGNPQDMYGTGRRSK